MNNRHGTAIALIVTAACAVGDPLPGTRPLEAGFDLAAVMVDGIHTFLDQHTLDVAAARKAEWDREFSPQFAESKRGRLREFLGLGRPVPDVLPALEDVSGVVTILDRSRKLSGLEGVREAKLPPREFLWRAYFELGHTLVGEDVRRVLRAVDLAKAKDPQRRIAITGNGDAGMVALLAAALDPRIDAAAVGGYFGPREAQWQEPIDRTVFGLLREFGDAELAALVSPRRLVVDPGGTDPWESPPVPAAPGRIAPIPREAVKAELARANALVKREAFAPLDRESQTDAALSSAAGPGALIITIKPADDRVLYRHQLEQTQALMRGSQEARREFWKSADFSSAEKFSASAKAFRDRFWTDVVGKLPPATLAADPRSRAVRHAKGFRAWEVVMDVYPDVIAGGILLVPDDIKPGEKRPVVVCQHGLEGRPRDLADPDIENPAYHKYGVRLAEQGYVVFAPQNPYIGQTHFRQTCRKAWPLGLTLWSFIVRQHERILDWLAALDFVDERRIGFYGLSYGGKTAMRVPALLERYALSICSADYNEWIWKNCDARAPYSYLYTMEYDMVEWNLGNTFNYAELSWLIFPRPFMVERGHDDGVSTDEWVAYEFARTFRHYSKLGLGDRAEIEFFNGPHTINGKGTFDFLRRHLRGR